MVMDEKVTAVLEVYHARIRDEEAARPDTPAARDKNWHDSRLLAVGPDTGRLINILARSLQKPNILELGTSYGYSGIWLAEAARANGGRVTTMELAEHKSAYAREMSIKAGLADHVDFKVGNAVELISELKTGLDFVLVDLWKDLYVPCLEAFYPKLNPGAIIVADNMIHPRSDDTRAYAEAVRGKPGLETIRLPVGSGLDVSRFGGF
jgi:predicted O-methyltransferase YrrM